MQEDFEGREDVLHRLQAFGEQPVDDETAQRVLSRARAGRRPVARWRSTKLKVAAAAAGGFLIGSVGLASAGSLPAPAQDAAHSALGAVGINVPPGHDRYNDPTKCPGGPYRNHGEYVRAHPNDPNAGQSPCGKPTKSLKGSGNDQSGTPDANGNGRHGPPPWAHGNKNKNKNKNPAGGVDDQGDDKDEAPAAPAPNTPAPNAPAPNTAPAPTPTTAAPPTTAPATTTTTVAATTTTAPPTTAAPEQTTTSTSGP